MASIKNLIREIHRRSLWQVLGIFVAASWVVLQVVDVLTETAGLPDWTPTMALVALLVGLPVCLATAFVQEGLPGPRAPDTADGSQADSSPSGAEPVGNLAAGTGSLDRPSTRPSRARRLLTWRNTIRGGVGAFALLGFSVVAYFVMWTAGVGPVGNLVAQGVITEGERVLIADFADGTGQGYADAVTQALRIDLLEASVLDLVEAAEIAPTLRLMQVEPGAELTAERALEAAKRAGIPAVIDGEVRSLGTGYLLTATLRATEDGRSLAPFRVTADSPDELIRATDELSQDLRAKSGESLRTIRAGKPLEQVTTSSLDALVLYTEAIRNFGDGRTRELMEQAVARDSTFAMAWRMLWLAGSSSARRAEALDNAFRLRHRLQDVERYVIEGAYLTRVDEPGAMEAYQNALRLNPSEGRALNNLAVIYRGRFDLPREEELLRRAVDSPERASVHYSNLVRNQLSFGRIDEAAAFHRDFEEAYPGLEAVAANGFDLLFALGDFDAAADNASERSDYRDLGRLAYWGGRLDEARSLFLRAEVVGSGSRRRTAYEEALVGDVEWARAHLREGEELESDGDLLWAIELASSGDAETADRVLQNWEDRTPEERKGPTTRTRFERASLYIRVERGDTARAVETMQRLLLESGCSDACWPFERARLHDNLNNPQQAFELYERVRQPGYSRWSRNTARRLYAMLRLGPLYDQLGETTNAIEAYQRVVDQWADADARGQETVSRFRERIAALGG